MARQLPFHCRGWLDRQISLYSEPSYCGSPDPATYWSALYSQSWTKMKTEKHLRKITIHWWQSNISLYNQPRTLPTWPFNRSNHKKNRYNVNIITKRYVFRFHSQILACSYKTTQSSHNVLNWRCGITIKEISNVVM